MDQLVNTMSKNAITVIDQELIDYFDEMLPYCSDVKPTNFPFYKIDELHKMAKDLIEINAELTKREQKYKSVLVDLVDEIQIRDTTEQVGATWLWDDINDLLKGDSDE